MNRFLPISLLVSTALMAAAAPAADAAIYMKFDGIQGSVSSDSHKRPIPIEYWSLNTPRAAVSGSSAGKVHYSDLSVMISLEKATPLLDLALAEGQSVNAVDGTFRAPAQHVRRGDMQDYLVVTLEDVLVTN